MKGNFSVQVSANNPFGKLEADKANRDTKTPGGTTGKYFPNPFCVKRYKLIFFNQQVLLIFVGKKVGFHLLTHSLSHEKFLKIL